MAITLYRRTQCRGDSIRVTRDRKNLNTTAVGGGISSIKLSAKSDRALFYKKKNWQGGVMFRCGKQTIGKVNSPAQGGKIGFGDTISSVRVTPFRVKLHINVVCDERGNYPGGFPSRATVESRVRLAVAEANCLWKPGLVRFVLDSCSYRRSDKKFDIECASFYSFPSSWKKAKRVNVFLVNTINDASGATKPPFWGRAVTVALDLSKDYTDSTASKMTGNVIAHELGHYFGIHHASANGKKSNLMIKKTVPSFETVSVKLTETQIQQVQHTLSMHVGRQGLRFD